MTSDFLVAAVQAIPLGLPRSNRSQVAAWKLEILICNLCVEDVRKSFSQIISGYSLRASDVRLDLLAISI